MRPLPRRVLLLAGLAALGLAPDALGRDAKNQPPPPSESTVATVYDGDTLTLETGDRIRLRWVNAPELRPLEPYGIEARNAAREFVEGKTVRLLMQSEDPRDDYGRVVAGIAHEGGNLSTHLLELGYAHLFIIPPEDADLTELVQAQRRAREARRGIWSTPSYQGVLHITSFHANAPGDDRQNVNGEYLRVCNLTPEPLNIEGYRLRNKAGQEFSLPAVLIPPGHTVKIHSGPGVHQTSPERQLTAHLTSTEPVWDNQHDVATLLDPRGEVVDQRVHEVKRRTR